MGNMVNNKFVTVRPEGLKFPRIFFKYIFLSIHLCKEVDICFLGYDISYPKC